MDSNTFLVLQRRKHQERISWLCDISTTVFIDFQRLQSQKPKSTSSKQSEMTVVQERCCIRVWNVRLLHQRNGNNFLALQPHKTQIKALYILWVCPPPQEPFLYTSLERPSFLIHAVSPKPSMLRMSFFPSLNQISYRA